MTSTARLTLAFPGDVQPPTAFWRVVRNLPSLCEGELVSCDITWNGAEGPSFCSGGFTSPVISSRVLERIAFWVTSCGGTLLHSGFDDRQHSSRRMTWDDVQASLVPLVAGAFTDPDTGGLFIDLEGCDPKLMNLSLDSATLFVPSRMALPLGDTVLLAHRDAASPYARTFVTGTVAGRMLPAQDAARQGFIVEVASNVDFTEWAARLPSRRGDPPWHRRDQRVPVRASGTLVQDGSDDAASAGRVLVENVSRTGALVGCKEAPPLGAHVTLAFSINGVAMSLRGTVVRNGADGTGIQFDRDPFANFRLAVEIERLSDLPRRALVIDDNALVRSMLTDALEQRGFEVTSVSDGDSGVRTLREQRNCIDAIITDVCMPGLAGEELVRSLRLIAGCGRIPIVAMTGTATAESVRRIEEAGVDIVLFKATGAQSIAETASALARASPGMHAAHCVPSAAVV
jgi:CheY-like chemotaxis protein